MNVFDTLMEFNVWSVLVRLLGATVLGGLIGIERGRRGRAAGLRTHSLVCLGAAMTALIALFMTEVQGKQGDVFRISAQVVSGIGFLGVGMILVRNRTIITGLTTAAGLWATAAIGIALGYGFYLGALCATLFCVLISAVFGYFERKGKAVSCLYLEVSEPRSCRLIVAKLQEILGCSITVDVISPKSGISGNMGLTLTVHAAEVAEETFLKIEGIQGVEFVLNEEVVS